MATRKDINIDQGADYVVRFEFTQAGAPKDMTAYAFRGQLKNKISDTAPAAAFTFDITQIATGVVYARLANATTSAMVLKTQNEAVRVPQLFCYDIEMVDGSGFVTRLREGLAKISPEVTK